MICLRFIPLLPGESQADYGIRLRAQAHELLHDALARAGFFPSPEDFGAGPHGKPFLKSGGPFFNLTHCKGLAACALDEAPCGIDAESIRRPAGAVARKVCSSEELAFLETGDYSFNFFRLWTLKESFVKTTGAGLSHPLRDAAFSSRGGALVFCADGYAFRQFLAGEFLIALCVEQPAEPARPIPLEPLTLPEGNTYDIIF